MDEDTLNREIRKFLKTFGVTANQELAAVLRAAAESGRLDTAGPIPIRATVVVEGLDDDVIVEGELDLA